MQWALDGGRVLRRVPRRGSKKGLSRRHLEGGNTPFLEYDPVGVRPKKVQLHSVTLYLRRFFKCPRGAMLYSRTWFFYSGGTDSLERLTAEFSASIPGRIKFLRSSDQKFYTPPVLGSGSKSPWHLFPSAVVVYQIQSPSLSAPNHKSQIASDLKSRIPNRKHFLTAQKLDV